MTELKIRREWLAHDARRETLVQARQQIVRRQLKMRLMTPVNIGRRWWANGVQMFQMISAMHLCNRDQNMALVTLTWMRHVTQSIHGNMSCIEMSHVCHLETCESVMSCHTWHTCECAMPPMVFMWMRHVTDSIHVNVDESSMAHMTHTWMRHAFAQMAYVVATISRLLRMIGLFCRRSSLLLGSVAKETYSFKEPTTHSHPIHVNASSHSCFSCECVMS